MSDALNIGRIRLELPNYLAPTPAGAFYAVQAQLKDAASQYLLFLLAQETTPLFEKSHLAMLNAASDEDAMQLLYRMQQLGYIQALDTPMEIEQGPLADILPRLLTKLSHQGKVVLADEQGFYLAMSGFTHETGEELSALSAGLHEVYQRHRALLSNNMGIKGAALGLLDVAGNSEIGFWPLYFSRTRFSLIISGMPRFNCAEFTQIINYLAIRYSH